MLGQVAQPWWAFVFLGLLTGILSGGLGIGGGTILVPALALAAGFGQKSAQGMALAVMVPLALLGAYRYWRSEAVEMNAVVVCLIVAGALVGTLAGTELAIRLPAHVLRKVFAVFLVIVAVRMFISGGQAKPQPPVTNSGGASIRSTADHDHS